MERDLKALTMDQLTGVIKAYPWFGAARMELCKRMSRMGGDRWGKEQYADAAMYIASRSLVSDIVRSSKASDYSDKDVETLIKGFITPEVRQALQPPGHPELGIGVQTREEPFALDTVLRIVHLDVVVVYVERQGVTEKQQDDGRHQEQEQTADLVPEDVPELLSDHGPYSLPTADRHLRYLKKRNSSSCEEATSPGAPHATIRPLFMMARRLQ